MPIALITGPANAGKAQFLMDAMRGHLARGEEPLLVVPTRADAEHYLRELAGEDVALGARVERFDGLIEEAVRRAEVAEPALGALARERVLAAIAADDGQLAGSGFVSALSDFIADLRVRRVTPAALERALQQWESEDGAGASRAELARLYARYHRVLGDLGRLDYEQRAVRALDALRRKPALWGRTPVLFYGFDDLTRLQLDAIETLGRLVDAPVTVSLAYEPGRTAFAGRAAGYAALAPLAGEWRELPARADYYSPPARPALSHLERALFEAQATRVAPGGAVRLLEGGGERAELELVAHEIAALLSRGVPAEEVAVVLRAGPVALDLLEEVFAQARIPYALQRRRRLSDSALGRALIGLLRCVPASGEPEPARSNGADAQPVGEIGDLLAWLRAPGVLERPELADRLELSARRAGVSDAAAAREVWEERHWPLDLIDQLAAAGERSPVALIDRAGRELDRLFSAPRRRAASLLEASEMDDARALIAARSALSELREVARIAPELAPRSAGELARTLDGVELVSGERPGPGTVAVLDPLALRARRVRALFLCRLQEGTFPARARPQPLLSEEERRRLAEASGLRLLDHEDALAAERYLLYATTSRPEELLVLSWHVSDDDGAPVARSLFVDDLCDLFDPSLEEQRARRALGAVGWDAEERAPAGHPGPAAATASDAPLAHERVLEALAAKAWSASSFETWIACPVRWFVERLLRPGQFEAQAEPLARGGLAHAALKVTLEELRRETGSARITSASVGRARELVHRALDDGARDFPLSSVPERRPGALRRLHSDLERYLDHAAAADSALEPSALELGFGFADEDQRGEASALPAWELGGGARMRGRIDRVDVGDRGQAVVYDYKASSAPAASRWLSDGNLQVALYMRAVEDLLGVCAVGGFYQPLSGTDLRARGLLERDGGVELDCVRGDEREHAEVREILDGAVAAAREAAAQAARGELQPRPRTCGYRGAGCMYPSICRCER
ncbi:MAG TPA: PD-(D/E)XK nuclease family protein [Solirubrobacteraceae bacterium]|jgi:ATP-dependent helicase/DNAse subunit B